MMGRNGLQKATEVAILNAENYMAARLEPHFPVLYNENARLVAHECIIDLRPLKDSAGVSVEDIAKRLMDFGLSRADNVLAGRWNFDDRTDRK